MIDLDVVTRYYRVVTCCYIVTIGEHFIIQLCTMSMFIRIAMQTIDNTVKRNATNQQEQHKHTQNDANIKQVTLSHSRTYTLTQMKMNMLKHTKTT